MHGLLGLPDKQVPHGHILDALLRHLLVLSLHQTANSFMTGDTTNQRLVTAVQTFSHDGIDCNKMQTIPSVLIALQCIHSPGSEHGNDIADNFFILVHCQVGAFGSLG